MKNLRKVSRTLLIATVMSGVVVIAGKIPAIENYSGQYAKAQELGVSSQSSTAAAAAARAARPKIRSVPSTGERAGKILVKAQEYISEEIPLIAEAKALLVKQRIERWNSTETAGYYQIMSSIAGSEDDLETVVLYYKKLLDIKTIPYSLRDQLTFSIGQIEFSNENYALGLSYLYDWLKYQPDPSVTQLEMFANAHYTIGQNAPDESPEMVKNYRLAIEYINTARFCRLPRRVTGVTLPKCASRHCAVTGPSTMTSLSRKSNACGMPICRSTEPTRSGNR